MVHHVVRGMIVGLLVVSSSIWSEKEAPKLQQKPVEQGASSTQHKPLQGSVAAQSAGELSKPQHKKSFAEQTDIGSNRHIRINPDYCAWCDGPRSDCDHALVTLTRSSVSEDDGQ